MSLEGRTDPSQRAVVRDLLNAWDPIGVADLVDDEYDCLIAPVLRLLAQGATRGELSHFLDVQLRTHFGLDPQHDDTATLAIQLVSRCRPSCWR